MPDTYTYPAIFYYDDDGISIEFPDLPGCLSCADTEDEAFKYAKEALELYMFGLEYDEEEIPAPSKTEDINPEENNGRIYLIEADMKTARKEVIIFQDKSENKNLVYA